MKTVAGLKRRFRKLYERRKRFLARRRGPRPLLQRGRGRESNACFTGWPGGLNYYPPGSTLPAGWVWTGFAGGFATNKKCYPPRGDAFDPFGNNGTYWDAQRRARQLGAALAAQQAADAMRAAWAKAYREARSAGLAKACPPGTGIRAEGVLSVEDATDKCKKKPGVWYCFNRWPGGWLELGKDRGEIGRHPDVWIGPTTYGVLLPCCYPKPCEKGSVGIGGWIISTVTKPRGTVTPPRGGGSPPITPSPPGPVPITPPPGPVPGPEPEACVAEWRCSRGYGPWGNPQVRQGREDDPYIVAARGDSTFSCVLTGVRYKTVGLNRYVEC